MVPILSPQYTMRAPFQASIINEQHNYNNLGRMAQLQWTSVRSRSEDWVKVGMGADCLGWQVIPPSLHFCAAPETSLVFHTGAPYRINDSPLIMDEGLVPMMVRGTPTRQPLTAVHEARRVPLWGRGGTFLEGMPLCN